MPGEAGGESTPPGHAQGETRGDMHGGTQDKQEEDRAESDHVDQDEVVDSLHVEQGSGYSFMKIRTFLFHDSVKLFMKNTESIVQPTFTDQEIFRD